MAAHTQQDDTAPIRPVTQAATLSGLDRNELDRICDSLESLTLIGTHQQHPPDQRRFVLLRSQELYNRLVELYTHQFNVDWNYIRHATTSFEVPANTSRARFAAQAYISAWFWDLYVSNRECVKAISGNAFLQRYRHEEHHLLPSYDPFLQHLNAVIRPTSIKQGLEDALYIPYLCENYTWDDPNNNVFGITDFVHNEDIARAINFAMEGLGRNNKWVTIPIVNTTLGRPGWLFDYRLGLAYAWFPMESNFSRVDLIAPFILGIPLTPRLSPRDIDDWQFFPGGSLPAVVNISNYQRVNPRRFYGSSEYRTMEIDRYTLPWNVFSGISTSGSKRAQPESHGPRPSTMTALSDPSNMETDVHGQTSEGFTAYRYRLIDWCYHYQVTLGSTPQARNMAINNFIFRASLKRKLQAP